MAERDALSQMLEDELATLGPVSVRRMFGGKGVFVGGLMFALVDDGTLYLKTDEATRARFEAEGLEPFAYRTKTGKRVVMSYWQAPDRVLDDADELRDWASAALAAARRAEAGKRRPAGKVSRRRQP